ncbi:MAG: magnesium/cobalt transporter CorA [Anaerolineales bacterium]|nr:magnesium/cobalt transporter CorA [Anaerolineales bacterium]
MIRSVYRNQAGEIRRDLSVDEIAAAVQDSEGLLWVDLQQEQVDQCRPLLLETFGFHPLAVEDALEERHVPKVDAWEGYIYLVLHAIQSSPEADDPIATLELDSFVGHNYLVTYSSKMIAAIERVWDFCQRDERGLARGVERLLYQISDDLVADTMPVIESIDDIIDMIEDEIFDNPGPHLLESIFTYKRALLHLRRILTPQREVINKLARGDFTILNPDSRIFFRDVYDHLVRLYDITEGLRDLVGGALDTYLSVVSNRMNEVMKTLTVITTLYMPLAFLTGFFGTNFFQPTFPLPAWTGETAFYLVLASMAVIPAGMYLWMRRRAWM